MMLTEHKAYIKLCYNRQPFLSVCHNKSPAKRTQTAVSNQGPINFPYLDFLLQIIQMPFRTALTPTVHLNQGAVPSPMLIEKVWAHLFRPCPQVAKRKTWTTTQRNSQWQRNWAKGGGGGGTYQPLPHGPSGCPAPHLGGKRRRWSMNC